MNAMAKTAKRGLGRGLDALLGGPEEQIIAPELSDKDEVVSIRLTEIDPNPEQPRKRFSESALRELADSIKSVGVIQPILVRKAGERYQIIAGERRFRASRLAGMAEIPAIVRDFDAVKRLEVALIENLQRDDLNPVEEARGVRQLMEQCGYTQEAAAERLGTSRPALANLLRLLSLPDVILEMLSDGRLSAGHGRALAGLSEKETQVKLANLAASQGWSVRQLERICAGQIEQKRPEKKPVIKKDPELHSLERMARDVFGTRAEIDGDGEKGKLLLHYFSADDLQRIWEVLSSVMKDV